jgi:hypothetical protein
LFFRDCAVLADLIDVFLEPPRTALRSPGPVPKTCPQSIVSGQRLMVCAEIQFRSLGGGDAHDLAID